jgi:uncharacterized protein (TIGR03437 family)
MNTQRAGITLLFALVAPAAAQTAANWTQLQPETSPSPRESYALAYDSAHHQIVLFGGTMSSDIAAYNDTWVWDGTNWTQQFPKNSPPGRFSHAMAYDSVHGQVVLFGGSTAYYGGSLNDTWVWDGTDWTQESPATSPPARFDHTMAYDSGHSQVVLFGGLGGLGPIPLNDTWVWDGTNWAQKTPATVPSDGMVPSMTYDSTHGQVVMFNGSGSSSAVDPIWLWDGANWTEKVPQFAPPTGPIAYDSLRNQIVLFDARSNVAKTWVWDGASWTEKLPQNSPNNFYRTGFAVAYDAARDRVVLFGGFLGGTTLQSQTDLNDTWTWYGGPPPAALPSLTSVVSASGFGGFAAVAPGSWVEIYGSNLAPDTRQWAGSDFSGNNAPTSLDGVVVNIGGQKTFIDYISSTPGQVNAQLPSNIATGGQLGVTLTNANGTSSAFNITVNSTEPGLLAPSSFAIGGKQYVVALLPDNATYILPTGAIPGVASRPAHPGETITLYGIGFGAVTPNIPAGQIVGQANQLAASFQILFGQTAAQVAYAGLAPGFVGLYQFDVVVPAVPDSPLVPLTFTLGGAPGTQTLYTAVQQ